MTYEQIVAAGIDPGDPENQHLYQFEAQLPFTTVSGIAGASGFSGGLQVGGSHISCDTSCGFSSSGYSVSLSVGGTKDQPELLWLVLPGKATWLKEFFNVQMMANNLASPAFTLGNGATTLTLPTGLALAPTAQPQHLAQSMTDIPGWTEPKRHLARPRRCGRPVRPARLLQRFPGTHRSIGRTHRSHPNPAPRLGQFSPAHDHRRRRPGDTRLPLPRDLLAEECGRRSDLQTTQLWQTPDKRQVELHLPATPATSDFNRRPGPGSTLSHEYVLLPTGSGTLDLEKAFVAKTAGDTAVPSTLTTHPAIITPQTAKDFKVYRYNGGLGFTWEAVEGASDYRLFSTANDETDFGVAALQTRTTDRGGSIGLSPHR